MMDIEFSNLDDGLESKRKHSKLMLCDLAGLEKREGGRQGERRDEGEKEREGEREGGRSNLL